MDAELWTSTDHREISVLVLPSSWGAGRHAGYNPGIILNAPEIARERDSLRGGGGGIKDLSSCFRAVPRAAHGGPGLGISPGQPGGLLLAENTNSPCILGVDVKGEMSP